MHISEGVLSTPVWISGAALTAGGVAWGLCKLDDERIPEVAILSSAFFVASLVHVPLGPSHVHLVLGGLLGLMLGWAAFPAMLVALFLQAVLFQFGGLTTLGVNTFVMAFPAVVCYFVFRRAVAGRTAGWSAVAGFLAGALAVGLAAALNMAALMATGEALEKPAWLIFYGHLPIMAIEGAITAAAIRFLRRVRPDLLQEAFSLQQSAVSRKGENAETKLTADG